MARPDSPRQKCIEVWTTKYWAIGVFLRTVCVVEITYSAVVQINLKKVGHHCYWVIRGTGCQQETPAVNGHDDDAMGYEILWSVPLRIE